jgi:hypothetical protein
LRTRFRPSRRGFLTGLAGFALLLLAPRRLWAEVDPVAAADTMRLLCDRMVPKFGDHPGAVALGVDAEVLAWFRAQALRRVVFESVVEELADRKFGELPGAAQDAMLAAYIDSENHARTAEALRVVRNAAVVLYFSKRESWKSIGYRTPQPDGYLDYARCANAEGADGRAD